MGRKKKQQDLDPKDVYPADEVYKAEDFYHVAIRLNRQASFWDENPDLMYLSPYRQLYDDKGHRESGKIMDAIYMVYDPKSSGNNTADRSESELKKEVAKHFLKDKDFQWSSIRKYVDAYKKDCRHTLEADAAFYTKKINELKDYLDKQPISVAAMETADLLKSYRELVKSKAEVTKLAQAEVKNKRLRGGVQRSRVERKPKVE